MWWTPPPAPRQALDSEARQIEDRLGLAHIVSISDHDSIDAPMQLQALGRCGSIPVSMEWTVPFRDTYFHLGIHNLPPCRAEAGMEEMACYTAAARARALPEMMASFHGDPECLIVLNHPFWDQPRIGERLHEARLLEFVDRFRPWIHALKINGLRDWRENRLTIALSGRCKQCARPSPRRRCGPSPRRSACLAAAASGRRWSGPCRNSGNWCRRCLNLAQTPGDALASHTCPTRFASRSWVTARSE